MREDFTLTAMHRLCLLASLLTLGACGTPTPQGPVVEDGVLEVGDLTLGSGEYQDVRSVRVGAGQWLSVRVVAQGFDPYLILRSPADRQSEIDDSVEGDTTSVETVVRSDDSGTWDISVTSYAPGESGSYRLTYEVTDTQPADKKAAPEATSDA